MKHPKPGLLSLPLLLLLCAPAQAFVGGITVAIGRAANTEGAEIAPFSADAKIETEQNQFNSRVYYQADKVRDESNMGGIQIVTIQRFDEGKVWVLMGQGMYTESEVGESQQTPEYKLVERTVEGQEIVNGMETTKYKTVYEGPDGRFGGFTWFTRDNIAVKGFMVSETEGEKQSIKWTMSNVQLGAQPDALFELPAGAQRMDMGNMTGGTSGAMSAAPGATANMPTTGNAAPGSTPPGNAAPGSTAPADSEAPRDPNLAEEIANDAATTAEDTARQETRNSVRDGVRKGIGKLFGR